MKENKIISFLFYTFKEHLNRILNHNRIKIYKLGDYSINYGPDFKNAIVKFNGKMVKGDIEVHAKAGDWIEHKHFLDKKYDNVILHIAGEDSNRNVRIMTHSGKRIPTVVLDQAVVMGVLQTESERKFSAEDFFELLPCWSAKNRHSFAMQDVKKKLQKFGFLRFRNKIYFIKKYAHNYDPNLNFYFLLWHFIGGKKNRRFFDTIWKNSFHFPLKSVEKLQKVIEAKIKNNKEMIQSRPTRPQNSLESRMHLFFQILKEDKNLQIFSSITQIYKKSENFFYDIRKVLQKNYHIPLFIGNMIIVNIIYPLLWVNLKKNRREIFLDFKTVKGVEQNHKVKRFLLNFETEKFSEIEMQGMIYIYDHFCNTSCLRCPIVSQ